MRVGLLAPASEPIQTAASAPTMSPHVKQKKTEAQHSGASPHFDQACRAIASDQKLDGAQINSFNCRLHSCANLPSNICEHIDKPSHIFEEYRHKCAATDNPRLCEDIYTHAVGSIFGDISNCCEKQQRLLQAHNDLADRIRQVLHAVEDYERRVKEAIAGAQR